MRWSPDEFLKENYMHVSTLWLHVVLENLSKVGLLQGRGGRSAVVLSNRLSNVRHDSNLKGKQQIQASGVNNME